MGFGLPAAMGCQLAFPDKAVACVTGEGSIQMNIQELLPVACTTAGEDYQSQQLGAGYGSPVAGYELQQPLLPEPAEDSLPDFVKLAESYGHVE